MEDTKKYKVLTDADPLEIARAAVSAVYGKQGRDILLYGVADTTVIADYYVICTGRSTTHIKALADEVAYVMGESFVPVLRTEGRDGGTWVLVDLGCVIVHIFSKSERDFYDLERLLDESALVDITDLTNEQA